jgi:uncharacterized protein
MRVAGQRTALHPSRTVRVLLIIAGSISLALGLIGVFLPLLPTTPFVLLAAACYARASPRFHGWLLANRTFGPLIAEWEQHGSIPYRTKVVAVALMSVTFAISITLFVRPVWLKVALAIIGVALAVWIYRLPSRDRPLRPRSR